MSKILGAIKKVLGDDASDTASAIANKIRVKKLELENAAYRQLFGEIVGNVAKDLKDKVSAATMQAGPTQAKQPVPAADTADSEFADGVADADAAVAQDDFDKYIEYLSNNTKLQCNNFVVNLADKKEEVLDFMGQELITYKQLSQIFNLYEANVSREIIHNVISGSFVGDDVIQLMKSLV
jgi:hypothetical protein